MEGTREYFTSKPQRRKFPMSPLLAPHHFPCTYHLFKSYTPLERLLYTLCVFICASVWGHAYLSMWRFEYHACRGQKFRCRPQQSCLWLSLKIQFRGDRHLKGCLMCVCYVGAESIPKKREEERRKKNSLFKLWVLGQDSPRDSPNNTDCYYYPWSRRLKITPYW